MNPDNYLPVRLILFKPVTIICLILALNAFSTHPCNAMSRNPEAENYIPSQWHADADPVADAERAIQNDDYQLIGFATRATTVPGIENKDIAAYRDKCGLRYLDGFGDVIRSDEQLSNMRLAREYALRYNAAIITECKITE